MRSDLDKGPTETARVSAEFAVRLVSRKGWLRRSSIAGTAVSCDHTGLTVRCQEKPAAGDRLDACFIAPPTVYSMEGLVCVFPGEVVSVKPAAGGTYEVRLGWEKPLIELIQDTLAVRRRKVLVLVVAVLAGMVWLRSATFHYYWYDPVLYSYAFAVGFFYVSRFYLSAIHKPPPLKGYEPTLSVVVAARNEEGALPDTVAALFAADYPPEKREVIVVDDGSTDQTPKVLAALQQRYPDLKVFRIPPSGKRFGMAKGFRESTGEIVVVVDSDTIVDRMALKHIVCGFEDPTMGAVSGYSGVSNADKNLLTRMQEVRYVMSYELMKAPEGLFGAVTCCPGVLSAYRRTYLLEILDPWLNQQFLGAQATFGDDRSLTNFILRNYRVNYNPLAVCRTLVPESWKAYLTQQARWKKSWLRETLIAGRFFWKKHPIAAASFYVSAMCSLVSPLIVFRALYAEYVYDEPILLPYAAGLMLLALSMAVFTLWQRPNRYWYLTSILVLSQVVLMGPQTYYAMLTMRKNHWGTR